MPDAIITSTASTFGTISGTFAADQSTITGTVSGIITGTLTGSVGVPGPAGSPGAPGPGVPVGGTAGQYLQKTTTGVDYATDWVTLNLSAYLQLAGGTMSGTLFVPTIRNLLNQNLVVDAYNDTGAGTHNYFNFNPFGGGFELPASSSGIKFGDNTVQSTAAVTFDPTGYATESWVTAGFYPLTGNPSGFLTDAPSNGSQYARKNAAWDVVIPGDRYLTSSTTSNTIGNGNKTFTIGTGLSYTPTQNITISYDASNHMHGEVLTYNSGTGVLTVDINHHTGSGTYAAWVVNVGGVTPATSVAWGAITGTLSTQTDLQNALNLKANLASPALTGNVTIMSNSTGAALFIEQAGTGNILTLHDQAADTTFVAIDQNGKINTIASSAAGGAGLNLPHGTAPTTPVNGDIWTTTTSLQWRRNGATATVANSSLANTFTAGQKQTVSHSATNAGLNIGPVAGDPSTLVNGDVWVNSTSNDLKVRLNGVSETVAEQSWVTAQSYLTTSLASANYLSKAGNLSGLSNLSASRANIGLGTSSSVVFGTIATTETGTYPDTTSTSVNNSTGFTHVYGMALPSSSQDIFNADKDSVGLSSSTFQQFDEFSPVFPLDYKNLIATKESITLNHVIYGSGDPPSTDYTETLTINRADGAITAQATASGHPAGSGDSYALSISSGLILTAYNAGSPSSMTVSNAQITFPDTTVQTTAYPGTTILDGYAPLASPDLSGVPTAPTATLGTNTTQIATTAFVTAAVPAFATTEQAALNTSATTLISPANYRVAGLNTNLFAGTVSGLSSVVLGAGANIGSGYTILNGRLLAPNALTAGYASRGFTLSTPSNAATAGVNFGTASGHAVRVYSANWGSTVTGVKMRGIFGRRGGGMPAPAPLAERGYGWEWDFSTRTMRILAHNGTTLTNPSVTWNPIIARNYEIMVTSNGSGTISLYIDSVLMGTTTGGPNDLVGNSAPVWWQLELQNEITASGQTDLLFQNPKVYTTNG